jgi:hypothetical protein
VVILGITQAIAGILAFFYVGAVIFAGAAYLGIGSGGLPALLFCLAGAVAGAVLAVKRNVAACRAVALWNLLAGLFFLLAVLFAKRPHPEGIIPAAAFLVVFVVLIVPLVPYRRVDSMAVAVKINRPG